MENIQTYIIGILGIIGIMILWVGVQTVWKRIFSEEIHDADALATRGSCGSCGCGTRCEITQKKKSKMIKY